MYTIYLIKGALKDIRIPTRRYHVSALGLSFLVLIVLAGCFEGFPHLGKNQYGTCSSTKNKWNFIPCLIYIVFA